jgi:nucleotide-binding universal stress UspA family protein
LTALQPRPFHNAATRSMTAIRFRCVLGCLGQPERMRGIARASMLIARATEAELRFLHVGPRDAGVEATIARALDDAGLARSDYALRFEDGDVEDTVLAAAEEAQADLVVAGAIEREGVLSYYIGSVARTIARKASCSVLLLPDPDAADDLLRDVAVAVDCEADDDARLALAARLAAGVSAPGRSGDATSGDATSGDATSGEGGSLHVIREYDIAGLRLGFHDDLDYRGEEQALRSIRADEENRLLLYLERFPLAGLRVERSCLCGRKGSEILDYARTNAVTLLLLEAPQRPLGFIDKFIRRDVEFALEALPCATLFHRPRTGEPAGAADDPEYAARG